MSEVTTRSLQPLWSQTLGYHFSGSVSDRQKQQLFGNSASYLEPLQSLNPPLHTHTHTSLQAYNFNYILRSQNQYIN